MKMSSITSILAIFGIFLFSINCWSSVGEGAVEMQGSIVEATCDIRPNTNQEQNIDLGNMTISRFIRNGKLYQHEFSIDLEGCAVENQRQYYQVTFNGRNNGKYFEPTGNIEGVVIQIIDSYGNEAVPGIPLPIQNAPNNSKITFFMRLIGDGELKAGILTSTIFFSLNYY